MHQTAYLEQAQDIGHHDGDGAGRCSYHSYYLIRLGKDRGVTISTAYIRAIALDECLDKGERLLEGICVPGASVQNASTQGHIRQQLRILVNEVDGKEHGFQSMDALLFLQLSAGHSSFTTGMHGEKAAQDDVAIYSDGVGILCW